MIELFRYQRADGKEPFTAWLAGLRDKVAQARIRLRLRQLQAGNFGEWAAIGAGVFELKVHVGGGYRIYFGRHGDVVVILLCGGEKRTQAADIHRAKAYWEEWKRRQT